VLISKRRRLAIAALGVVALVVAVVLGLSSESVVDSPTLFARDQVSCGSPWSPDYSKITTTGVTSCAASAEPLIVLSAALLIIAALAGLVLAVTWSSGGPRPGEVPPPATTR
jgi:hypothetical protein